MSRRTKRINVVLAFSIWSLCTARADSPRLVIQGHLSDGLNPELTLNLTASNPFCGSRTKTIQGSTRLDAGRYEITADWSSGFCNYKKGSASLTVKSASSETTRIKAHFGEAQTGYQELHEVATFLCGDDPDLERFECSAIRDDGSAVIGQNFYLDPETTGAKYEIDILEQ